MDKTGTVCNENVSLNKKTVKFVMLPCSICTALPRTSNRAIWSRTANLLLDQAPMLWENTLQVTDSNLRLSKHSSRPNRVGRTGHERPARLLSTHPSRLTYDLL